MEIVWKRILIGVGIAAALVTPASAKHASHYRHGEIGSSAEARVRHHGRQVASASQFHRQDFVRSEHPRLTTLKRLHRMAAGESTPERRSSLVAEARRYLGGNPTGWAHDWCGKFMNLVLERTGRRGSGSNLALSFKHYGRRVAAPQVGALAVMARRRGGHVGVVSSVLPNGKVKVISGNHSHKVAESVYHSGRILAYVMPTP